MGAALIVIICLICHFCNSDEDFRPIYIIGHMANSKAEMTKFLEEGANGLEVDIKFTTDGTPEKLYHGSFCDCRRNCIQSSQIPDAFFHLRNLTLNRFSPLRYRLAVLYLDMKTDTLCQCEKYGAGRKMAELIVNHLWAGHEVSADQFINDRRISVLIGVSDNEDEDTVSGVLDQLRSYNKSNYLDHIGFAFDRFDHIYKAARILQTNNFPKHMWFGSGITNCMEDFNKDRLSKAVDCSKTDPDCKIVDRVFTWTLDLKRSIRAAFLYGINAVMTNQVKRAREVIAEKEFRSGYYYPDYLYYPWTP